MIFKRYRLMLQRQARRQFKKRFGMIFVEYARARRMGLAMKHIRDGNMVIDAQLHTGYESGSGFRDAFSRIMGAASTRLDHETLKASWLDTPLGPMIGIADESVLHLLAFVDRRGLELEVERLRKKLKAAIIPDFKATMAPNSQGFFSPGSLVIAPDEGLPETIEVNVSMAERVKKDELLG